VITAAVLLILMHVLPPYRPSVQRLRHADAAALVEVKRDGAGGLQLRTLQKLVGEAVKQAHFAPGHRLPRTARFGLATFRKKGATWVIQEHGREWIEIPQTHLKKSDLVHWKTFFSALTKDPETALIEGIDAPLTRRFAARDLNALLLQPQRRALRLRLARRLGAAAMEEQLRQSLHRHMLHGAAPPERAQLLRSAAGISRSEASPRRGP
jgi:hypothetical protein